MTINFHLPDYVLYIGGTLLVLLVLKFLARFLPGND